MSSYRVVPAADGDARRADGDARRRRRGGEAAAPAAVGDGADPPRRGDRARARSSSSRRWRDDGSDLSREHAQIAQLRAELGIEELREGSYSDAVRNASPDPELLRLAREAAGRAYAPYSNFPVGAAVLTDDGRRYAGANVENAAYPQGQCAEASALGAMVAGGGGRVVQVVVAAPSEAGVRAVRRLPPAAARVRRRRRADPPRRHGARAPHHVARRAAAAVLRPGEPRMSDTARAIQERAPGFTPRVGLVLGSGLGALVDELADAVDDPLRRHPRLPRRHGRGPRRRALARHARRRPRRLLPGPLARLRGDRGERGHHPDPHAAPARRGDPRAHQRRRLAAPRGGPRQPRRAHRPHQHAGLQPAHGAQRRRGRPALPEPLRRLRPRAARRPARRRRRARHDAARRRLPRGHAARASRRPPRSGRSARSAPTSSG